MRVNVSVSHQTTFHDSQVLPRSRSQTTRPITPMYSVRYSTVRRSSQLRLTATMLERGAGRKKRGEEGHLWPLSLAIHRHEGRKLEQGRQCTYNVTMRRVRTAIVAVEKQCYLFWVCVCSFMYRACNAHAPCCHLWLVRLYNIFPHYLTNGAILCIKKLFNTKCVFYLHNFGSETFLILRRLVRDMINNVHGLQVKYPVF
jgi:hypothetical protein